MSKDKREKSNPGDKLIITAAITGSRNMRDLSPYIPYTPEEIAQSALECWRAGAAVVHIHVRDPQTGLGTQSARATCPCR
jgi:uncharacterized protein (DUF849 family)